ncbi:transporter [Chitinimonas arctica]|uniref:Transporter n=1 Tax=Chitinimonas arctica TaxID=2594795 RepID=A0A516SKJ2_9NEIS|nr:OmpP1/FadL family transporter [Chitinimonas arctica]QDQ28548.1 transporter [Chitinimonas arctica]
MTMHALRVTALLVGAAFAQQALASGYHFGTQSVSAQGTANASGAAVEDASTLFYNPAGLTSLPGTNLSGVLDLVVPHGEYTDTGSHTSGVIHPGTGVALVPGARTKGNDGGTFVKATAVPHAFFSHQLNDKATVGFGVFVPFGSKTKYDDNWVGRYNVIETELKTIALNPSFAFKISDKVSIGGGLTAQFIEGKLVKAADFGSGAVGSVLQSGQITGAQASAMLTAVGGNPAYSGDVHIKGDDWGFGWNLGVMFNIDPTARIGFAYRSKIKHELSGEADWTVPQTFAGSPVFGPAGAVVQAGLNGRYVDSAATLKVDTPESFSLSGFKQVNDKLALMADITRTRHSRFKELRVDFASSLPDSVTPENWDDTTKVSFGGSYQLNDKMKLRAGVAYDESPVDDANRTPSIPDGDRKWFSLGMNYGLTKHSSVDVAYSFVQVGKPNINNFDNGGVKTAGGAATCNQALNTSSCATIVGQYKVYSHIIGLQYNTRF